MATAVRRLLSAGSARRRPPGAALRLFGYAICPFCHVVRSAARYTKTTLALTEVNPLTKAEIKFSTEHRKVPIAVFDDGSIVVESAAIVDEAPPAVAPRPKTSRRRPRARGRPGRPASWRPWSTRTSLPHMASAARRWPTPTTPSALSTRSDRHVGALGMSMAHGKIKKKYGIEDERAALFEKLGTWEARRWRSAVPRRRRAGPGGRRGARRPGGRGRSAGARRRRGGARGSGPGWSASAALGGESGWPARHEAIIHGGTAT